MHTDKLISRIKDGLIEIENITDNFLQDCLIHIKSTSCTNITFDVKNIKPYEKISYPIFGVFKNTWGDKIHNVKVYHKHRLIYEKNLNDKTKCFVLLSNKKFELLAEQLIVGLDRYTNVDILHYTIGYESTLNYPYLKNIKIDINGDIETAQFVTFIKPIAFLDVLERGYEGAVFIDADVQVTSQINDVFNYLTKIEDGPIFQRAMWDYSIVDGMYIPGPKVQDYMGIVPENQISPHGVTNCVIFSKKHIELFREWKSICFSNEIEEIRKTEFLHDELLLNCLMWKKNIAPKLEYIFLNISGVADVNFYYNSKSEGYQSIMDLSNYNKGFVFQSFLPYDKTTTLGFHCVKDPAIAKSVNDLIYKKEINNDFSDNLNNFYHNMDKSKRKILQKEEIVNIINNYVDGPFLEIRGEEDRNYHVEIMDGNNEIIYNTTIKNNMWVKTNKKYYDDYKIRVSENGKIIYNEKINLENKRVYISLESNSLGDTLAWFPYIEEFRKKHKCKVITSTFMNNLFEKQYPEIEFVTPGISVENLHALYRIGWFYDDKTGEVDLTKNPTDFKKIPLQKTASDILGLDFKEVRPLLKLPNIVKKKKIGIGFHSTAQSKYWNNPTGWQEVVDYLNSNGYEVVLYSKEGDNYMGNKHPKGIKKFKGGSLQEVIDDMSECEYFIGIGSGLSWLAWSIGLHVVLISGFSDDYAEMKTNCTRIINKNVCHGCFNKERLDAGDWNWCPVLKGTNRQFECTKEITGSMVIERLKNLKLNV